MRIAVTGATGLLGRAIAIDLRESEHTVTPLSRSPQQGATATDLTDPDSVREAIDGADVVVHAAGKVGDQSRDDVNRAMAETLGRVAGAICPVINLSSVAVYGSTSSATVTERTPCRPASDYGQSKLEAEKALQHHAANVCHLRIANVLVDDHLRAVAQGRWSRLLRANERCNLVLIADVTSLIRHLCTIEPRVWPPVMNVVRKDLGQMRYRQLVPSPPPFNVVQRIVPRQTAHLVRRLRGLPSLPNRTFSSAVRDEVGFRCEPMNFTLHSRSPWITCSPTGAANDYR